MIKFRDQDTWLIKIYLNKTNNYKRELLSKNSLIYLLI
jgi:hypothetical protein